MSRIKKVIFRGAITVLVLCLLVWIAGYFIPLEFSYAREEEIYDQVFFILPLIAIALTLAGTVKKHDTPTVVSSKVFLTFTVMAIFFIVAASNSLNQL